MVGAATYFVISADEDNGLPPMVLAAGGLVVGAVVLGLLGLVGLLPMDTSPRRRLVRRHRRRLVGAAGRARCRHRGGRLHAGIAAGRRLGSRLASFVALLEVVAGVGFAWLLLGELPRAVQLVGGLLILAGVVGVKLGERTVVTRTHRLRFPRRRCNKSLPRGVSRAWMWG